MRQIGLVESINGQEAVVRIKRASACGENCASCSGGCTLSEQVVNAQNNVMAKAGDTVILEMESKKVIFAAVLVYVLPLLVLIVSFIMFNAKMGEGASVMASIAVTAVFYALVAIFSKKLKNKYKLVIEKVL